MYSYVDQWTPAFAGVTSIGIAGVTSNRIRVAGIGILMYVTS